MPAPLSDTILRMAGPGPTIQIPRWIQLVVLPVVLLVAFSLAIYFARRDAAYQQLGRRAVRAADQVLAVMRASEVLATPVTKPKVGR